MELEIWDPRKGQDYVLNGPASKRKFSSLEHDVFAIEMIGVDWHEAASRSCFLQLAGSSPARFLTCQYVPWIRSGKVAKMFEPMAATKDSQGNYIVAAQYDEKFLSQLLGVRRELGGNDSGEWFFIGSQDDLFADGGSLLPGISPLLDNIKKYEWLLCMAELQQTFLFFREFGTVDLLIDNLKGLVKNNSI